jgi:hypothetical protein
MKGKSFSTPNTGRSPVNAGPIVHTKSGANVPASYAQQQNIVSRIAAKATHIKKGGW